LPDANAAAVRSANYANLITASCTENIKSIVVPQISLKTGIRKEALNCTASLLPLTALFIKRILL